MKANIARFILSALCIFGLATFPSKVFGVDRDKLTQMLVPSYIAADIVGICGLHDATLTTRKVGQFGSAWDYSQHAKLEITEGLAPADARAVRVTAAEAAKAVALDILKRLRAAAPGNADRKVALWCENSGVKLVRETAQNHDAKHDEFLTAVKEAKMQK